MTQIVQHVAYGMNADSIPKMTENQLIAAFFQADTNLPSIKKEYRDNIRHNMALIQEELGRRIAAAKGKRRVRMQVNHAVMQTIVDKLYC